MAWLYETYTGQDYEDSITCSVEQILEVCKLFEMRPLSEAEQLEVLTESAANATGAYKKLGVKNPEQISSKVTKASKDIAGIIKKEGINKASKAHIKSALNTLYDDIARDLEISCDAVNDKSAAGKIKQSTMLLFGVITVNTMCLLIFQLLFGAQVGSILTSVIVAPLTEEGSKQVAIKGDYIKEYMVLFNIYEASSYVVRMTISGVPFLTAVKVRLLAAGIHVTTAIIQWLTQNKEVQKKIGIDKDEKAQDNIRTMGNIIGIVIHCTWNTLASFSTRFVSAITGMD